MGLCSQCLHLRLLIFTNKIESWCCVQACFSANNTQTHTVAEVKNRPGLLQRTHRGKHSKCSMKVEKTEKKKPAHGKTKLMSTFCIITNRKMF